MSIIPNGLVNDFCVVPGEKKILGDVFRCQSNRIPKIVYCLGGSNGSKYCDSVCPPNLQFNRTLDKN